MSAEPWRPLLELDAELGRYLGAERLHGARRDLSVAVGHVPAGPWRPGRLMRGGGSFGLLVLSGLLACEVCVEDTMSAELLGAGDVIRPAEVDAGLPSLVAPARWTAMGPSSVGVLDARALVRYPELMLALLDRCDARTQRLVLTKAIAQMTGVDRRVEALLWHIADRWGKVTPPGVLVPLNVSHRVLGGLVGARRPTVSTALTGLAADGRLRPCPGGGWLLLGPPPSAARREFAVPPHRLRAAAPGEARNVAV